jgi:hypothetical protein
MRRQFFVFLGIFISCNHDPQSCESISHGYANELSQNLQIQNQRLVEDLGIVYTRFDIALAEHLAVGGHDSIDYITERGRHLKEMSKNIRDSALTLLNSNPVDADQLTNLVAGYKYEAISLIIHDGEWDWALEDIDSTLSENHVLELAGLTKNELLVQKHLLVHRLIEFERKIAEQLLLDLRTFDYE